MSDHVEDDVLRGTFESAGLSTRLMANSPALWDETLSKLSYAPVWYSRSSINYQLATQRRLGGTWTDYTVLILHDGRPCGLWPLTVHVSAEGQANIGSQGLPLVRPAFVPGLGRDLIKSLENSCLAVIDQIKGRMGIGAVVFVDAGDSPQEPWVSTWQEKLMEKGARLTLEHDLYVDLRRDLPEIVGSYRSRYRSLINKALRTWDSEIVITGDEAIWTEFHSLHVTVAGRATRSDESWALQRQSIEDGNAFLVALRDADKRLIGGGFFEITRDEGQYSVGAYDRSLFDLPVGHAAQHLAIQHMKERGLRWYRIGRRPYPGEVPTPTEKEISIGHFKEGFSSHLLPRYLLKL